MMQLPKIHMFWHGNLSRLERLCISSFVANGHSLYLHCYEKPNAIPNGVILRDANETIPRAELFFLRKKASLAAFADYFRFSVLNKFGGIWVDTDMVCLKPFDYSEELIFSYEDEKSINCAVLGLPKDHAILKEILASWHDPCRILPFDDFVAKKRKLVRRCMPGNPRERLKWGELGPVALTQWVSHLGLNHSAKPFWHFYPVHWCNWRSIFDSTFSENLGFLGESRGLHLWNEMLRRENIDKNSAFNPNSLYEKLISDYLPDEKIETMKVR